jgi:hypothetical protein
MLKEEHGWLKRYLYSYQSRNFVAYDQLVNEYTVRKNLSDYLGGEAWGIKPNLMCKHILNFKLIDR